MLDMCVCEVGRVWPGSPASVSAPHYHYRPKVEVAASLSISLPATHQSPPLEVQPPHLVLPLLPEQSVRVSCPRVWGVLGGKYIHSVPGSSVWSQQGRGRARQEINDIETKQFYLSPSYQAGVQ